MSRLFVTKVVLICTVGLAHERSECDKHGANRTTSVKDRRDLIADFSHTVVMS
ncbi:hypothetical protein TSAR_008751 [Trichomalopsis sarcophagae]|uniref:Uncharacterized protein n=1 Tax=Trichomalopsis sarcophagae TaxID=543379 RepID=A0A232FJ20_9HYME|nr:hypothetical protein TSAR_008751 [Trichomalopsis sarcophagae]